MTYQKNNPCNVIHLDENVSYLQVVFLDLVQPIIPFTQVLFDVSWHPGCKESSGYQLRQPIQSEVGKQTGIGQVVLKPKRSCNQCHQGQNHGMTL